jgi:TonB family protein
MIRQKHIFLVALGASLLLHMASLGFLAGYARLRGWGTRVEAANAKPQAQPTTAPADELIVYPEMGDAQGTGIGSNSSPGEREQLAREADADQALLSRNPQGAGRIQAKPSDRRGPEGGGTGGAAAVAPLEAIAAPVATAAPKSADAEKASAPPAVPPAPNADAKPASTPSMAPVPVASPLPLPQPAPHADTSSPAAPRVEVASAIPAPQAVPDIPKDSEPMPAQQQQKRPEKRPLSRDGAASAKPQAAETGDGRQRGVPPAAGNPLPQSESDSDPFSRISGNITIPRAGRLEIRMGRKVKTTRPQVNIAGQLDLIALNNPTVVLEVHIAPTGNVTDVRVARSSGSNGIDEPTRVAVYEWWFEPARDKSGKPVPDVIYFAVQFL